MNHTSLKTFAQDARNKLRQLIAARLDYVLTADTAELRQHAAQVNELRTALKNEGRDPLIERAAYTWFNRLAALGFMDANGYHPFGARVITPATANETLPELLQQARAGALDADFKSQIANPKTFEDLLAGRIPVDHPEAQVYRLLLVAACNYYHRLMPFMFEKIGDATELLLPDDLLTEHSIVADFRENLADDDCRDVEVIGWLYQHYISEKKDAVMARKAAVPTEDIPAVTQLFTPHWIVRYLVENSLGRLWLLNRPNSRLREKMPYYIEGESETDFLKIAKPEEIRLLDPAGGSGHMLTYAFDLLYAIYEEEGYDAPEIPSLILRHNLYGLDICERAAALASFALCMKARSRDNRFFRRLATKGADVPRPAILELREVRFAENELRDYIRALGLGDLFQQPLLKLLHQFEEAKNFGSLIQPCLDERTIAEVRRAIEGKDLGGQLFLRETHLKVLRVLAQAEALTQRYHVVVANPPYLGNKGQNGRLKLFLEEHFDGYNTDLFAAFIVRGSSLALKSGLLGFMAPNVWMFLSTHNALRELILNSLALNSLVELPLSGFTGATVQVCAFTLEARRKKDQHATFIRLCDFRGAGQMEERTLEAIGDSNCEWVHKAAPDDFAHIPGSPIAYWLSPKIRAIFATATSTFEDVATPRQGLGTGENSRFTRFWSEVGFGKIGFGFPDSRQAMAGLKKWFPYTKGGGFRKWTGNEFDVVNWEYDGKEIRKALVGKNPNIPRSEKHYFREGITWGLITSAEFSAR